MFDLKQVAENTYYIEMPSKIGIYNYSGNDVVLIDSGNDAKIAERALRRITEKGWQVKMVLNTHCHADHCGGNRKFEDATGCKIYCPDIDTLAVSVPILNPVLLWGAYPIKELDGRFYLAEQSNAFPLSSATLPSGIEVIPLNGHSMGMVGYKTADDIYFIADSVCSADIIEKYKLTYLIDLENYLNSLDKICAFEGKLCIPSHCEPTRNITALAEVNRRAVEDVLSALTEYCKTPRLTDDIIDYMFTLNKIRFTPMQYALIGSTVKSYLSYLQRRGTLKIECNSNKIYWQTEI